MEHVISASPILDSCSNIYRVTISGMSFSESPSSYSLCSITQALGFKDINGESIPSVFETSFNLVLYPTDPWNMVSNIGFFRFLLLRAFLIRCSNTRIVCSSPYSVGQTNLHTCITLAYSHPSVRLSACFSFVDRPYSFRVITSTRAYRDLFQYITG